MNRREASEWRKTRPHFAERGALLLFQAVGFVLLLTMLGCGQGKNTASAGKKSGMDATNNPASARVDFIEDIPALPHKAATTTNTPLWEKTTAVDFLEEKPWEYYARLEEAATNRFNDLKARAEQGDAGGQYALGGLYSIGLGVTEDRAKAVEWYRKAAGQGLVEAQFALGQCYELGDGVPLNQAAAAKWYHKAAEEGYAEAQYNLARSYYRGNGVERDYVAAYKWVNLVLTRAKPTDFIHLEGVSFGEHPLAILNGTTLGVAEAWSPPIRTPLGLVSVKCLSVQSNGVRILIKGEKEERLLNISGFVGQNSALFQKADKARAALESRMSVEEILAGQKSIREFKPRKLPENGTAVTRAVILGSKPEGNGTGFFITENGFFITCAHVITDAAQIRLATRAGIIAAKVVTIDPINDLALLKAEGKFLALPLQPSGQVQLGESVVTLGFPNVLLQGLKAKLTEGRISGLSGIRDEPNSFQISVPVQPGNSGGALVNLRGNVVGVVSARLNDLNTLANSGSLPQNVNYAVKSSYALLLLESLPEVSAKLRKPSMKEFKVEEVAKQVEDATAMVLLY